jgi:hypothetical protein
VLYSQEKWMTALIWAAFHGELEEVQELVKKLPDVNVVDEVRFYCIVCCRLFVITYEK